MALPIRTTVEDIGAMCAYLANKPTGATLAEAKAVLDKKYLDGRKLAALRFWGLMEDSNNKMKVTELGRLTVKDSGSSRSDALKKVIRQVEPYLRLVELCPQAWTKPLSNEVASHWYEHFRDDVADSDKILNDQAICFFHIAQGADLGTLVIGRGGNPIDLTSIGHDTCIRTCLTRGTG